MLGFINLDFPLKEVDLQSLLAGKTIDEWIGQIEIKMESWEITDDKDKIAVCRRNLTGDINEEAGTKTWGAYDDFKRWLGRTVERAAISRDIERQFATTVQVRSFRDYEKRFLAVRRLNKKSLHPISEQTIISYFLRNIRSMDLRHMLLKQIFTNYDALVEFAEDMIRKGRIKERYPSNYPARSEPPTSSPSSPSAFSASSASSASSSSSGVSSSSSSSGRSGSNGSNGTTSIISTTKDHYEARPGLFGTTINPAAGTEISTKRERMFPKSNTPEPAESNGEGWRTRMLFALVDHPLDLENEAFPLERDAVKAWLAELEQVLALLDFRNNKEEVSFCVFNARGILAKAVLHHGEFSSFAQFRKWVQALYGLPDQKRDVVRSLMTTVQSDSLRRYIFQFRKLLVENQLCKYPVSPELIGEFFVDNLRDEVLQSRLEQTKLRELKKLTLLCEKLLDLGEVPDNYLEWESASASASQPVRNPNPNPEHQLAVETSLSAQAKRFHLDLFYPHKPRNVRVKTEPPPRPMELREDAIELFAGRLRGQTRESATDSWRPSSDRTTSWKYRD